MKKPSNQNIDEMIARALGEEDRAAFEALGEPNIFDQIAETFRGQTRWISRILIVHSLVFTTLFGVGAYRFFGATELRDQILWASVCILSMVVIGLLKMWYWMELNRVSIMREIKRLELQVALLANARD